MQLTEEQKTTVAGWVESGIEPGEVQRKLKEEFGMVLTYLDLRLLLDDLKIVPKETETEEEKVSPEDILPAEPTLMQDSDGLPAPGGKVRVSLDQITRPNALVSGKVTFSDGQSAEWQLDMTGRLALNPTTPGYRPTQEDVMAFQMELQRVAQSQGF